MKDRPIGTVMDRVFNFSPGPAVLPLPVLEQARDELLSLPGVGISILEISHRSPAFDEILEQTMADLRGLVGIGSDYDVLLLQGGASLQFSMVPMNLLRGQPGAADYVLTGTWGVTGVKEARRDERMSLQQQIAFEHADNFIGYELDVLIDQELEDGVYVGRSFADAPEIDASVIVTGAELQPGDLVPVEILQRDDYDLVGIASLEESDPEE